MPISATSRCHLQAVAQKSPCKEIRVVAYPAAADNISGPLLSCLQRVNQLIIRTRNRFLTPHLCLLAYT